MHTTIKMTHSTLIEAQQSQWGTVLSDAQSLTHSNLWRTALYTKHITLYEAHHSPCHEAQPSNSWQSTLPDKARFLTKHASWQRTLPYFLFLLDGEDGFVFVAVLVFCLWRVHFDLHVSRDDIRLDENVHVLVVQNPLADQLLSPRVRRLIRHAQIREVLQEPVFPDGPKMMRGKWNYE